MKQIKNKYIPIQKSRESSGIEFGVTLKCAQEQCEMKDLRSEEICSARRI